MDVPAQESDVFECLDTRLSLNSDASGSFSLNLTTPTTDNDFTETRSQNYTHQEHFYNLHDNDTRSMPVSPTSTVPSMRFTCSSPQDRDKADFNSHSYTFDTQALVTSLSDFRELHYVDESFDATLLDSDERMCKSLDYGRNPSVVEGDVDYGIGVRRQPLSWNGSSDIVEALPSGQSSNSSSVFNKKSRKDAGQTKQPGNAGSGVSDLALKTKFLSAWTNVKNGWVVKTATSFKCESPIWLLGQQYVCNKAEQEAFRRHQQQQRQQPQTHSDEQRIPSTAFEQFKVDFHSRIWLTYRCDFVALDGSQLTTDMGWGCMLRSAQMLLAQTLVVHFLHREWRWNRNASSPSGGGINVHRQIVRYFGDIPSAECPFSIHRLVSIGQRQLGKNPGDWYGPDSISKVLREALLLSNLSDELVMYIATDGTVYIDDVINMCTSRPESRSSLSVCPVIPSEPHPVDPTAEVWCAVVILIPVRLGAEILNPDYVPCLTCLLANELCMGIIGGRPKHSLYFIGWQDDKLIHLDPHCCQDTVDVLQPQFSLDSFHCVSPRKLSCDKMDPSCTIGFYCRTRMDFDQLVREMPKIVYPPHKVHYSMFHFQPGSRHDADIRAAATQLCNDETARIHASRMSASRSDDFTFL